MISVTQVLSPFIDFSAIPEKRLMFAAARGTVVHSNCALIAQGLWCPQPSDEISGYVDSFENWFHAHVDEVYGVEVELVDTVNGFCGHPDLICRLNGDKEGTVIDIKTPLAESPVWKAQIAAYGHLADVNKLPVKRLLSVRLSPTGKRPKIAEYTKERFRAWNAFLGALSAWKYLKGE
jgi:hypothetical protein